MLGVGDAGRMLVYLKEKRMAYCELNRNEKKEHLALEIYGFISTSPSANLELRTDDWEITNASYAERFELAIQQPLEDEKKACAASPATVKLVNFEEWKGTPNDFEFVREAVPQQDPTQETTAETKPVSLLKAIFPPSQPPKLVPLRVFILHPSKPSEKVKLSVPESATAAKVLDMVKKIQMANKKKASPELEGTWLLRIAEDDGSVDPDLPPLRDDQSIFKLGEWFAMVCVTEDNGRKETAKLARVILPNAQYQTIPFDPSMKVSVLLRKVCEKWHYKTTEYAFTTPDAEDELIPGDITLRDLDVQTNGKTTVVLRKRQANVEDSSRNEKSFNVVKLKKFKLRQERVITIAPDIITNHSTKTATKKPVRLIRDVKYASLPERKPRMFNLQFEGEDKVYTYKAKSEAEAKEIVAKINLYKQKASSTAG